MIFDGSTHKTAGVGFSKEEYTQCRVQFTLDRNNSVINRLRVLRKAHDNARVYVTYAGIRRELENEIDLGEKTIAAIVSKLGLAEEFAPCSSIRPPRKVINSDVPPLVIPKDSRRFLTQAWA